MELVCYARLLESRDGYTERSTNISGRSYVSIQYGTDPEKAMAPNSSTLAWKIPWMEEPGRLQSMGSLRVGHD